MLAASMALAPLALAPATLASCAPPEPLERVIAAHDVVLVGTITDLANDGRWAKVQVEEIWKGPDFVGIVEVRGGPEPGQATSVDRVFEPGRYLFTLGFDGTTLTDNACSGTTTWSDDLTTLRPADWRGPEPTPGPGSGGVLGDVSGLVLPGLAIALVAALIIGGSWLLSRRAE